MVKINGSMVDTAGKTIKEYLSTTQFDMTRIAVELNGEIVSKKNYDSIMLNDGDCLEIVSFVGGG